MANPEGFVALQAPLIPNNLNPRGYVTDNSYVKGSPQVFPVINDLVAFHPNRLKPGNSATILNYPAAGTITDFRLVVDPSTLLDASGNSIVTLANYAQFWEVQSSIETSKTRVYQYSPDGPGGGAPVFPYTTSEEHNWVNTFDNSKGHRWLRFRDDDIDADHDGIYDNWTAPIPVNNAFSSGDYLENRFKRQAISGTIHTNSSGLQADKYYIVDTGQIQIDGDLSLNDIGAYGIITTVVLGTGRRFKFASANTYIFINFGSAIETIPAPPRTVNGTPNNEPMGWSDSIPGGSAQLWEITGQKSVYGQLKSDWNIQKIIENPTYIRYNNQPTPHPDTLADTTHSATTGSAEDLALIAAGWVSTFNNHTFIAKRSDDPDNIGHFLPWQVEKINEESGEYTDSVFKLFDLNLDFDSPDLIPPSLRDPTSEGWSDTPLEETSTQINYVSQARKFFNGELKTEWSQPIPYTGKDIFSDVINSDLGDAFKYDINNVVSPSAITLKAELFKGLTELWQDTAVTIIYQWVKVFDGGVIVNVIPTSTDTDPFYVMGIQGTVGDVDYARAGQRLFITNNAVDGNAVFRCTQTIQLPVGDDIVFQDEFSIVDVTDGKDAKSLVVTADKDIVLYDTINSVFLPASILLRAYSANIPSVVFYWYLWNGASWTALANGVNNYSITGNILTITNAHLFAADNTAEEKRYAASNHASNPDSADFATTFSDYITIVKLSSAGVGSDGVDSIAAISSNEAHTIVIDSTTNLPFSGEITSTGKAKTTLQVYHGITKLTYGGGGDYTIAVASDNGSVTFGFVANGTDVDVYVATWGINQRSAVCTITITYGATVFTRKFSISSTKDAPGAVLLDINSDRGFIFTPTDKGNKLLTAKLYDTGLSGNQEISLPSAAYTFRWNIAGVWGTTTTSNTQTITRSNILVSGQVSVEVYFNAVLFRSRTITIADVNDGRSFRAWTDQVGRPTGSDLLTSEDPTSGIWPKTPNTVIWYLTSDSYWTTHTPTFAQDAQDNGDGSFSWGIAYQLKGEKGDQGGDGGFFFPMYIASGSTPSLGAGGSSSTLAQMITAGWTSKPPASGIIWRTERAWIGEGMTLNGSGDPSTEPFSGSTWASPVRLSATDGTNGVGSNGINGWTPVPAITAGVNAGEKVIRIVDYTGGDGTKPTTGLYVTSTGLSSNINLAQVVTGEPVTMRFSGGFVQWKYVSESAGSWRNLYQPAQSVISTAVIQDTMNADVSTFTATSGRTYSGGSWTNTLGFDVLVELNHSVFLARDSGASDFITLSLLINNPSANNMVGFFRLDGDSWTPCTLTKAVLVASGATLDWSSQCLVSSGGLCNMANNGKFYVKIIAS